MVLQTIRTIRTAARPNAALRCTCNRRCLDRADIKWKVFGSSAIVEKHKLHCREKRILTEFAAIISAVRGMSYERKNRS